MKHPKHLLSKLAACVLIPAFVSSPAILANEVASPDGRLVFALTIDEKGTPFYSLTRDDQIIVNGSRLGLQFAEAAPLVNGFEITSVERRDHDATWEQPWGERRFVREHYREMLVGLASGAAPARRFNLRVRAFDDGIGFRYEVPAQSAYRELAIVDELTEFRVPVEATAWWIPGRGWNRYEFLYRELPVREMTLAHSPVTIRLDDGTHLSIHEAALRNYAGFTLDHRGGGILKTLLAPGSDGASVRTAVPFVTPWRTIQITADAKGLLNSDLILNLNEPNVLGDVSWVEPGKYVGIWWAMHIGAATWGSGQRHGATTAEAERYIDFAAKHGFDGVLVEGWNLGWDGSWFDNGAVFSFTEAYPDFDIEAVSRYALERGVRLVGHNETSGHLSNYERQMEPAFDLYESLGVHQVKTGYVAHGGGLVRMDGDGNVINEWHDGQFAVEHFERVLVEAAKRRVSINTHEPVKATGLRRTFPNWLTREGARGQEYNAGWSKANPPSHNVTLPYTRLLGGPMDFTPGIFDLQPRGKDSGHRVQSTLAHQLALYVTIYSPIQMAADLPENYEARPDAFQFIVDVPADWERSIALDGEIGDFVAYARQARGGEDWFVGVITNEDPRSLNLPLDFLTPGVDYVATIYRDDDGAHWRSNPYAFTIARERMKHGNTLELWLAAGGGAAVHITPFKRAE